MNSYNGMQLREVASAAGQNPLEFEALLEFVEWTGFIAPDLALGRARDLRSSLDEMLLQGNGGHLMRAYHECRLALETAVRYQHSSGDALARLLFMSLGLGAPEETHLATFDRALGRDFKGLPAVAAVKQMRRSDEWAYIHAFCNTLKHVSLVEHEYSVVPGADTVGIVFKPFAFKGRAFPARTHSELEQVLEEARSSMTVALNLIQRHLSCGQSG